MDSDIFQKELCKIQQKKIKFHSILENLETKEVCGYAISFPSLRGKEGCHDLFDIETPNCYYTHDVCIRPKFQGMKLSKLLLEKINENAKKYKFDTQALLSVESAVKFWSSQGFKFVKKIEEHHVGDLMEKKIL
jgi:GNAT superfamily N-acetyltransferase